MDINSELSQSIFDNVYALSWEIVNKQHTERSGLAEKFKLGFSDLLEFTQRDLHYLAEAVRAKTPAIYENQAGWLHSTLQSHGVPEFVVNKNLEVTRQVLLERCPGQFAMLIKDYMAGAIAGLNQTFNSENSFLNDSDPHYELAWRFLKSLLAGDRQQAGQITLSAVQGGVSIADLYMKVMQPCLYEVGRLWQANQINVAQEHYFSAATQMIMSQLYPQISSAPKNGKCLVACCVPGELHEIGLRMATDLLETRGWETHYSGSNTPLSDILESIKENKADALLLSASGPPYINALRTIISSVRKQIPGKTKVIVGGLFFSLEPSIAKSFPADGFAANALEAVKVTEKLVGIR